MATGGAAIATAAGAQAPARTGAGAAAGGVTAEGGAAVVTADTAEEVRGAAIKAEGGGVTAITAEDTGDTATVETGATPDGDDLINTSLLIDSGFTPE